MLSKSYIKTGSSFLGGVDNTGIWTQGLIHEGVGSQVELAP